MDNNYNMFISHFSERSSLGQVQEQEPQNHYDLPVNSHIPGHYDLPPVRRPPSPTCRRLPQWHQPYSEHHNQKKNFTATQKCWKEIVLGLFKATKQSVAAVTVRATWQRQQIMPMLLSVGLHSNTAPWWIKVAFYPPLHSCDPDSTAKACGDRLWECQYRSLRTYMHAFEFDQTWDSFKCYFHTADKGTWLLEHMIWHTSLLTRIT